MKKKTISIRLKPEVEKLLAEFQGNYQADFKKRISQSEAVNIALVWYIQEVYRLTMEAEGIINAK